MNDSGTVKIRTLRDSFEEYYDAVKEPANNKKGYRIRYVYKGQWVVWDLTEAQKRNKDIISILCLISGLALLIGGSLIHSPLTYSMQVQLPAMLALAASAFEAIGVIQFVLAKKKITMFDYKDINAKMLAAPFFHAVFMVVASAIAVWMTVAEGYGGYHIIVPLCYILSAVSAAEMHRRYRMITTHKETEALDGQRGK